MRDLGNIIKKYWWGALLVIIAPILINYLILQPAFFNFVGEDTDWLSFWGAYIGTILSSVIAFYVLYKQLQQNHDENEANRKLQINFIEYQQKSMWLNELKTRMYDYFMAFSQNDIISLIDCYSRHDRKDDILKEIKRIKSLMSLASYANNVMFIDSQMEEKKNFIELASYEKELYALLDDLEWLANILDNRKFIEDREFRLRVIKGYKENSKSKDFKVKSRRAWRIIEEETEKISICKIAETRIKEGLNMLNLDEIKDNILKLISFEQKKINKIIQDNNATK